MGTFVGPFLKTNHSKHTAALLRDSANLVFVALFTFVTLFLLEYGSGPTPLVTMAPPVTMAPTSPQRPWEQVVADKLVAGRSKIPEDWRLGVDVILRAKSSKQIAGNFLERLLDAETRHITSYDVADLRARMANGSLSALQVVTAYCKSAAFAHQLVCLVLSPLPPPSSMTLALVFFE